MLEVGEFPRTVLGGAGMVIGLATVAFLVRHQEHRSVDRLFVKPFGRRADVADSLVTSRFPVGSWIRLLPKLCHSCEAKLHEKRGFHYHELQYASYVRFTVQQQWNTYQIFSGSSLLWPPRPVHSPLSHGLRPCVALFSPYPYVLSGI